MSGPRINRTLTNEQLIKLHAEGVSCKELAKMQGCSWRTMNSDLHALGVVLRHPRPWLDVIDSDIKAYALGFLWADGCVERNTINVAVQARDVHILESLKEASGFGKIFKWREAGMQIVAGKIAQCSEMWCLRWNSKQMRAALQSHGLCYNKMKVLPE